MRSADRRRNPQFTVAEVAAIAGVKPFTVRQWIVRGHLHRNARGKIDGRELVAYLDRRGDRGQHTARKVDQRSNDVSRFSPKECAQ